MQEGTKKCSRCREQRYCSRECQQRDWKSHKRMCGKPVSPFVEWHVDLSRERVYERFVVSFQLRVEDEYVLAGNLVGEYGEQAGDEPCAPQFQRYLERAKAKKVFPPDWTSDDDRKLMEVAGQHIHFAVEKHDVMEKYGNLEPMVVRLLAEHILGPVGTWV
ncbi:hypothetical protein H310_09991 [Aphanomyces invadans]|uniref:MYND-type domain-containing protein n=1 Tax=Aphanomyces invadans TaxID=157072 RepID=A0A024TV26_9STRA|nr:hypothetical protein H310_09991 [Aphanomyces invadans]ETV97202.1 hypothetical protein H310_09991 [Aphanomyces invadans]|eukprot:XP_008874448.1 hypothetical protein H310_09991 [Aphanomyces invadans]